MMRRILLVLSVGWNVACRADVCATPIKEVLRGQLRSTSKAEPLVFDEGIKLLGQGVYQGVASVQGESELQTVVFRIKTKAKKDKSACNVLEATEVTRYPASFLPKGDGCMRGAPELVLKENMMVTAVTPNGRVRVKANRGLERTYVWGANCKKIQSLVERAERARGSCGAFNSAESVDLTKDPMCEGIVRVIAEEMQLNFPSEEAMLGYMALPAQKAQTVYRNDGLGVSYGDISMVRFQIVVSVFQILINGKKPIRLPGAQDDRVALE